MASRSVPDLEDLARRYDAHVLREYLLEQEMAGSDEEDPEGLGPNARNAETPEDPLTARLAVYELRSRCFRTIRLLLVCSFLAYWITVAYCAYVYHLHIQEMGTKALPPMEVGLLAAFVIGTQSTLELAFSACLTRPHAAGGGFHCWDGMAWAIGLGARVAIFLDAQVIAVLCQASDLLFFVSFGVFVFAIGVFVFAVQARLLLGLFCPQDLFAPDKPDLFFKGGDPRTVLGPPIAARPPSERQSTATPDIGSPSASLEAVVDRPPPVGAIKLAHAAQLCDLTMLHAILTRLYIPVNCQESQEFVVSVMAFSRCFCEDVVQCTLKFFFILDFEFNQLVFASFLLSAAQAFASCAFASTSTMDLEDMEEAQD